MKQASRAWFNTLSSFLVQMGFVKSHAYRKLFVKHSSLSTLYCLIYVDDIMLTRSHETEMHQLIKTLNEQFSLKYLGLLNLFLRIEVKRL